MDVSENGIYPQIIHFNRVFHYKPFILGYPCFWKHPYPYCVCMEPYPDNSAGDLCGMVFRDLFTWLSDPPTGESKGKFESLG